jgi:hypothetical protein
MYTARLILSRLFDAQVGGKGQGLSALDPHHNDDQPSQDVIQFSRPWMRSPILYVGLSHDAIESSH